MNFFQKTTSLFTLFLLLASSTEAAYRDVRDTSETKAHVDYFIEQGILDGEGFFKPYEPTPAVLFYDLSFQDSGFNPKSATFDTPLPGNINPSDEHAQVIREAIRRGFVSADEDFEKLRSVKRLEAIQQLVKIKGILPPEYVSTKFRDQVGGVPPTAQYLAEVEAAFASGILEEKDLRSLRPDGNLARKDLIRWLYNWNANGKKSVSSLNKEPRSDTEFNYQKRQQERREAEQKKQAEKKKDIPTIKVSSEKSVDLKVLEETLRQLEVKYKFSEELTDEKKSEMINAGIKALVNEVGDKYTSYVTPDQSESFISGLTGEFEGIGAYVEMIGDEFTITSPLKGSPAEKAGLRPSDVITHVNGEDIAGQSSQAIILKIRGTAGTDVILTIQREGSVPSDYTVTRGQITIPDITLKMEKGIPIVGIHQFNKKTGQDLKTLLENEVLPEKPRGIIFDLRNNPGGFLTAAVDVGGLFVKEDQEIFSTEYKSRTRTYDASENGILANIDNLVFLQNKGTASASEILTAMIKDLDRGTIIGTSSVGKGTVQEIVNFSNGGHLKLTVAKWLSPKDNWINEVGVIPDIEVTDPTDEEKEQDIDRQLDTAVQTILQN